MFFNHLAIARTYRVANQGRSFILVCGLKIAYFMGNEVASGPAGAFDGGGHPRGGGSDGSPLQTRAAFIKNWDWQSVVGINRGACQRGGAQHGFNSETSGACEALWEEKRRTEFALVELIEFLKGFHRRAPFLFFNGNTFSAIGRQLVFALFSDLPMTRKREVGSAVAHYIAGVLDRKSMVAIVESLSETADWKTGDRVKTLRGSLGGVIVRILDDGRVCWRPDNGRSELVALPESLVREKD